MTTRFSAMNAVYTMSVLCLFGVMSVAGPAVETTIIPFNESVRIGDGADAKEVKPGTEEYYNLRIKGLCHVDNNRLVASRVMFADILQVLEGNRLWVRELIPASGGSGAREYRGHVPADYWIVAVSSTEGMDAGARRHFQVAEQDVFYRFTTDKGVAGRARGARSVESPSLEEYLELSGTAAENVGLVVSLDPERQAPASAARRPRRGPARVHVRNKAQDVTSMTDGDLAKRMSDFQHRRNFISRKLKQRQEAVARVQESLEGVENEQEQKSRAGMLKKLQADVERVRFELEELDARYNEIEQEYKSR
jgi:ketosteroid isomerase-like protein